MLDMINASFAMWLAVSPVLCIIFGSFMRFSIETQLVAFGLMYSIYLLIRVVLCRKEISFKDFLRRIISLPAVVGVVLFLWVVCSAFIHKANSTWMYYISYFMVYLCFRLLGRDLFKFMLYIFLSSMLISVVLSLISPMGVGIPGYLYNGIGGYSMQFVNPNYSAYIVATLTVVCAGFIKNDASIFDKIFFPISFLTFTLWLYCNGSFVPIAAVYLFTFILLLYRWIRERKCPYLLLTFFVLIIPMSFIVDMCTFWVQYRNCSVGFFRECLAVIDNIFHIGLSPEEVPGADGWGRKELIMDTFRGIFASVYTVFLGYGAGTLTLFRPHMQILSLWVELGLVAPVCYATICIWTIVRFFKCKCKEDVLPFFLGLCAFLVMSFFGSMMVYTFTLIVPIFGMCHAYLFSRDKQVSPAPLEAQPSNE